MSLTRFISQEQNVISPRQVFNSTGWNLHSVRWDLCSRQGNLHSILWNGGHCAQPSAALQGPPCRYFPQAVGPEDWREKLRILFFYAIFAVYIATYEETDWTGYPDYRFNHNILLRRRPFGWASAGTLRCVCHYRRDGRLVYSERSCGGITQQFSDKMRLLLG